MAGKKKEKTRTFAEASTQVNLAVPTYDELQGDADLALGLRQTMLTMGDERTPEHGELLTGTGLGSDAIILKWKGRTAVIFGRELFKAWVQTFAPEDAARMP